MRGQDGPFLAVHALDPYTAAAACFRGVAHNQIGIDHQVGTRAVAESGYAIQISRGAAAFDASRRKAIRGRAHDYQAAAIRWDGGVGALIEQDRVVLDVAVLDESHVSEAAAITCAQIA